MNKLTDFIKQVYQGRTIYRIYLDWLIAEHAQGMSGEIYDLAGGGRASYRDYLPLGVKLICTDYQPGPNIDAVVDLNQPLPFADRSINNLLFCNAVYIIDDRAALWRELFRVLAPAGKILIASPFIANEMPEPHDYCRLTAEGLDKELRAAGFSQIKIIRFGERFTAMVYLLQPFLIFKTLRLICYSLALGLDKLLPKKLVRNYPTPLGYFCIINKDNSTS